MFWQDRDDPLHPANDFAFYDLMAGEMLAVLRSRRFSRVLELGCGNGAFYRRLGFDRSRYVGVDFSPAMVSSFRKSHPGVQVETADAREYVPAEPVDLVYSGNVLQYLSLSDIDRHLGSMRDWLDPHGMILHAFVPWNVMRWPYYSGELLVPRRSRSSALALYLGVRSGLVQSFGYWHSVASIRKVAARHDFDTTFYGSLAFPYRFSVRMVAHAS